MEAVMINSSSDQSISPYKQQLSRRNSRPLPSNYFHGGVLHAPPPLYFSSSSYPYPPPVSQPPLLPLPIPKPHNNPRNRGISCPPINRKIHSRKTKPDPKTADPKRVLANRVGPRPNNQQKDVSMVQSSSSMGFTLLSPPPSSLPLPTFSLRPKLSCNAEVAAGIDAGATDNLRRLLRLR